MIEPKKLLNFRKEQISRIGENEAFQISWTIPNNLDYFDGHFPNNPILPAVGILDVSLEFLRTLLGTEKIYVQSVPSAKISELMTPGLAVVIQAHQNHGVWVIHWKNETRTLAEFQIRLWQN